MLDRHSEIIAHFIGQFDQAVQETTYRLQYDAFRAQQRLDEEPGDLLTVNIHVSSELLPDKHIADRIDWKDTEGGPTLGQLGLQFHVPEAGPVFGVPLQLFEGTFPDLAIDLGISYTLDFAYQTPIFEIGPPGGMIMVVYNKNIAQDNDIFLMRALDLSPELAETRTDAAFDAALNGLAQAADTLAPGDFELLHKAADTAARIETLRETYDAYDPDDAPEGAEVTLVSANTGTLPEGGMLLDGEAVDEAPDALADALDSARLDDAANTGPGGESAEDDGEGDGDGTSVGVGMGGNGAGGTDAPVNGAEAEAPLIVAGGNLLLNSAASALAPVDAGVIAVGGQAISLTVISQVNVLSDRDTVIRPDGDGTGGAQAGPAGLLGDARPEADDTGSEGHNLASVHWESATRGTTDGEGGPIAFAVTEIEGDLVLTTHVVQINLVTDNDVITFETAFHTVQLGTGENVSVNMLSELGFQIGFDMILVAGDMLNLVSISQMNVAFDDDLVVDTDGTSGAVETSDNLLWNEAHVTWHGIDTLTDQMSESSAEALATMGQDKLDFDALKSEALLEGKEVPLLLTIGGNLVLDYRLEQINILADADTVQVFADAAAANGFVPVDVETGDNLLANVANLEIHGQDSTVMASGGVYSDVVIHQAGMYDTDDAPLDAGEGDTALASEAVVFLADGMIEPEDSSTNGTGDVIIDSGGSSGSFDTLGGVVA